MTKGNLGAPTVREVLNATKGKMLSSTADDILESARSRRPMSVDKSEPQATDSLATTARSYASKLHDRLYRIYAQLEAREEHAAGQSIVPDAINAKLSETLEIMDSADDLVTKIEHYLFGEK